MRTRSLFFVSFALIAFLAFAAWAQSVAPAANPDVTARAVSVGPGLTSAIATIVVVAFENHASHPVTVARYHVEWSGGRSRVGDTGFVVPAHGRIERRMHLDGTPPSDPSAYRIVFATRP